MLMTEEKLSALQQALLEVLQNNGGWVSRSQIADVIGRPDRLVPHDVDSLENLVDMGLVKKRTTKTGVVKTVMQYHIAK